MENIQKKIVIISLIFNLILWLWFLIIYIVFYFQWENKINFAETNTIKIIKKPEIIKNSVNPVWILKYDWNLDKNIFSGFFIDKKTILTVAHWVNNEKSTYEIIDINWWKTYLWKLVFKDDINDLAKIEIQTSFGNFRKIKAWNDVKVWEKIHSYSFSKDWHNLEKKSWTILEIDNNKIKTDIIFQDWNSWGMVINEKNEILWIIVEVDEKERIWYFIKINEILKK